MYRIAVVGATGNVGREILNILVERKFPVSEVYALASERSYGKQVSFGDSMLKAQSLSDFDFSSTDIAIFSAGSKVSAEYAPIAAKHAIVIDNTSYFRMQEDVPLIVPEVNAEDLVRYSRHNIIASPNCAATQMVMAMKPLHEAAGIKRVIATTFQSVSGAGKKAMDELYSQTKARFLGERTHHDVFPKSIAFNVIPHIGEFNDEGHTAEEIKIMQEVQKIIDPTIQIAATCVRIPVFVGHSVSLNLELHSPLAVHEARMILENAPGVVVQDENDSNLNYTTPIECVGDDEVYVSRIRADNSVPCGLNLWVVSDNLRKGAALNTIQIAEELIKNYI